PSVRPLAERLPCERITWTQLPATRSRDGRAYGLSRYLLVFTMSPIFTSAVNIGEVVNHDEQLEAMALQLLRSVPGVEAVETAAPVGSNHRVDGIVRFSDRRAPVVFEVKRHANAATAWQLIGQARHLGG